jgi:hypothetical protein
MNIEILNWLGPPWEGDWGEVKKTGRTIWGCNTYMHGNTRNFPVLLSLSQTSKNTMFLFLSFMFFLLQNLTTVGWNRFCLPHSPRGVLAWMGGGGERGRRMNIMQIMYTHV